LGKRKIINEIKTNVKVVCCIFIIANRMQCEINCKTFLIGYFFKTWRKEPMAAEETQSNFHFVFVEKIMLTSGLTIQFTKDN